MMAPLLLKVKEDQKWDLKDELLTEQLRDLVVIGQTITMTRLPIKQEGLNNAESLRKKAKI